MKEWLASYKCESRKAETLCSRSPWTRLLQSVSSLKFESLFPPKTALIGHFFPILFLEDIFQNVRLLPSLSLHAPRKTEFLGRLDLRNSARLQSEHEVTKPTYMWLSDIPIQLIYSCYHGQGEVLVVVFCQLYSQTI